MADELAAPAQGAAAPPAAPTGEEVTSAAPPQEGTPATPESATPPLSEAERQRKAQETRERIEELNARYKAAVQYGDFFRQQFEAQQTAKAPPAEPAVEQPAPEPQEDAFDDPKAYAKAYGTWARKEAAREARAEAMRIAKDAQESSQKAIAKAREDERLKGLDNSWQSRANEYATTHPDFWIKAQNPAMTFMHGDVLEAVKGSEMGPQIVDHIASSPQLVAKLAGQTVPQRLATLGRIEAELSRPAPPPKVTAAPAPPTPIAGASGTANEEPKDITDWMLWRNKQDPRFNRSRR